MWWVMPQGAAVLRALEAHFPVRATSCLWPVKFNCKLIENKEKCIPQLPSFQVLEYFSTAGMEYCYLHNKFSWESQITCWLRMECRDAKIPSPLPTLASALSSSSQAHSSLKGQKVKVPPGYSVCPWNSPGKNTGVGSHSLLLRIFPTQGSNPGLPHRQILYRLSHLPDRRQLFQLNWNPVLSNMALWAL